MVSPEQTSSFAATHGQYGNRCRSDYVLSNASEDDLSDAGCADRSHDDQVNAFAVCTFIDRIFRMPDDCFRCYFGSFFIGAFYYALYDLVASIEILRYSFL